MDSRIFLLPILQTHPILKRRYRVQDYILYNPVCSYPGAPRTVCSGEEKRLETHRAGSNPVEYSSKHYGSHAKELHRCFHI